MAEWNQHKAIEDYTELSRRVRVGAYVELEIDGSFPEDDGTPESTTLSSLHNLEELAARHDLEFVGNEQGGYSLEPMSEETRAARAQAQEWTQAERRAQEQAALDIPYVIVGEAWLYQYHEKSGRWYVEVHVQHHDPDQGAAIVLYRVWKTADGSMAAMKVDSREVQSEEEYQDTQHYMEHHYLGGA